MFLDHNSGTDLPQIMVGELKRIKGMFLFHGLKIPRGNIVLRQSWVSSEEILFNPIPAGVLENQDTLGGGQFDPPL